MSAPTPPHGADARPRNGLRAINGGPPPAPPKEVVAVGNAVVAAAKVGRIFGRSYLRMARQLPGAKAIEREATRLARTLVDAARSMDVPRAVYANADEE